MALPRFFDSNPFPAAVTTAFLLFTASAASAAFAQQTTPGERPVQTPPNPPATLSQPDPDAPKTETPKKRIRFGPQVGVYLPTDSKTRDRFGGTWTNIGIGIGNIADIHRNRRIALDINFISNSKGDQKVFLAPIGLAYSVGLGNQQASNVAYAGVSANLVIASLRSDRDNLPTRTSVNGGASVFLGTRFSNSGYVEARYNALGKIRGFDLSGINLTAGFRF